MENNIARFFSLVFHPLILTTYFFVLTLHLPFHFSMVIPVQSKWMITGLVFITTFAVPALLISIFSFGMKKLTKPDEREERYLPFAIAIIFYFMAYYLLNKVQLSPIFNIFNLGATTLLVLCLFFTLAWKISVYMAAAGAFTGALLGLAVTLNINLIASLVLTILISGFIGFSRIRAQKHTPAQVYAGYLLGAVTLFLHYLYF